MSGAQERALQALCAVRNLHRARRSLSATAWKLRACDLTCPSSCRRAYACSAALSSGTETTAKRASALTSAHVQKRKRASFATPCNSLVGEYMVAHGEKQRHQGGAAPPAHGVNVASEALVVVRKSSSYI